MSEMTMDEFNDAVEGHWGFWADEPPQDQVGASWFEDDDDVVYAADEDPMFQ